MIQVLKTNAQKYGDKEAIVAYDVDSEITQVISYKKLYQLVIKTTGFLTGLGIKKGDRFSVLMDNTPEVLLFEWAGTLIGATTVPLDFKRDTLERKLFKLKDTSSKVLFAKLEQDNNELKTIQKEYPIQVVSWSSFVGFEDLLSAPYRSVTGPAVSEQTNPVFFPDNLYVVLYTSGTTAMPRGVLLSIRACLANAQGIINWQKLTEKDRFNIVLPLHHINSTEFCLATLLVGGTIILNSRYSASKFWQVVAKFRATNTSVVPTILHDLLMRFDEFKAEDLDISSLKRICIGSAPVLPEETLRFYQKFGIRVVQGYGQTETALRVAGVPVDLEESEYLETVRLNSIGTALSNNGLAVMDKDNNEKKEGEEGEICIKGPVLADGYLNNPKETAWLFNKGWFHSGDLGYFKLMNGDKYYFLIGRIKEIIIKGGVNLSPSAIEDSLLKNFPAINEVAVVGYEDIRMGEEIAACIVAKKGIDGAKLVQQIITAGENNQITGLSPYEVPKKVLLLESLPKTSTGKIQRFEVKKKISQMLKDTAQLHYYVRQIQPKETEIIKQAVVINNERFAPLTSALEEFEARAKNGILFGVFEEKAGLVGSLTCMRVKGQSIDSMTSWAQATDNGTLKNSDPAGDTILCVAISVKSSSPVIPSSEGIHTNNLDEAELKQLAQEKIEEYVNSDCDHVLNFHRQGKAGLPGAKVWKILEGGRKEDQSSMGYNVLMKYPVVDSAKLVRSNVQRPSILLIENALLYAKEKGIKEVVAFSRPSGFRQYLIKQLPVAAEKTVSNPLD
ncbi:acyl--CoA ligase [Candidatus Daviesbacteria bacterium]|nr:acyl--CoA ligase [Candidatus Daviesbacteria bacterium]